MAHGESPDLGEPVPDEVTVGLDLTVRDEVARADFFIELLQNTVYATG